MRALGMDAAKFLSDLCFELEELQNEIRLLERYGGTEIRSALGLELSACELKPFRRKNVTLKRGARMFSLQ